MPVDKSRFLPPVEQDQAPPAQPPRPPLVWFFTLWFLLFAGFQPMGLAFARLFAVGITAYDVLRVPLALLNIVATYNAWRGKDWGRVMMLWVVTLFYAVEAFLYYLALTGQAGALPDVVAARDATGRLVQAVLLGVVNVAFCLHPATVRYYRFQLPRKDN